MTKEEKDLLIKDLCARLPYGVKCKILGTNETKILASANYDRENTLFDFWEDDRKIQYDYQLYLSEFKPYLFPMSSMTDELYNEFFAYYHNIEMDEVKASGDYLKAAYLGDDAKYEWLNRHNFDYRYLIEKGLAIDCTNLNIY